MNQENSFTDSNTFNGMQDDPSFTGPSGSFEQQPGSSEQPRAPTLEEMLAEFQRIQQELNGERQERFNLQRERDLLFNLAQQAAQGRPAAAPDHHPRVKIAPPERYNGRDPEGCRPFLSQCESEFDANPKTYVTDTSKISWAISYLKDDAYRLIDSQKSTTPKPLWLANWLAFKRHLLDNYGPRDDKNIALRKLQALKQISSVQKYWVQFSQFKDRTDFNDQALMHVFRKGLKDEVKDLLVTMPTPQTLNHLRDSAVDADNRLHERYLDKHPNARDARANRDYQRPSAPQANGHSEPRPMDLDAVEAKRFGPLTQAQRKYRMDNDLCLYCGGKDHKVNGCPKRDKNKRQHTSSNFLQP
jgi:hypothetical protein